jgi:hydroxymethylpyrimidine/phosphomethylpyrimidine kinase
MAKPIALSIGGWDPCGGAGLAADIKTFEMHQVLGMGVCTALTHQTEDRFIGVEWTSPESIKKQMIPLLEQYSVRAIKFGIIENLSVLLEVINTIRFYHPMVPIIWDPILKASAGFAIHSSINQVLLSSVLENIALITPNLPEKEMLFGKSLSNSQLQQLLINNHWCLILLKGGHATQHSNDVLISYDEIQLFEGERFSGNGKHGTGCVLSASICANLAYEISLDEACRYGKQYVERFILSSSNLMGYHVSSDVII